MLRSVVLAITNEDGFSVFALADTIELFSML